METFLVLHSSYCTFSEFEIILCAISSLHFADHTDFFYFSVSSNSSQDDVFDLKVTAKLNAFNVFVCDQKCNIADIRIHGK